MSQLVRPRSAAASPCRAARPSARSDPQQRRAQLPRSLFAANNDRRLCAKSFEASIGCSPRSARQATSASRNIVRLTLPSSGLAKGQPLKANVRRVNAFVGCFCSLRLGRFVPCRRTGWLSLGTLRSRAAQLAVSRYRCSSERSRCRRFKHRAPFAIGASNPSFERTASGSRSIPTLGKCRIRPPCKGSLGSPP